MNQYDCVGTFSYKLGKKLKVRSLPYMPFIRISSRWVTELNNKKKKPNKIRRENVYDSEVRKA